MNSVNILRQEVPGWNRVKQRIGIVPALLLALWLICIWVGERTVFQQAVGRCTWQNWESWPHGATPHHILFVADPQIVDPHTYPGRPWPLSSLTVYYTDLYMRRSYRILQDTLRPDSTIFLGDLFDGGREWSTSRSHSPEERFRKYDHKFWLREYYRFSHIFFHGWQRTWSKAPDSWRRKLIASVPGNHDLGFAGGIQLPVKNRFDAYFGPLNRIDVIGNHSFVSLDTVSLSAMDQVDSDTGSAGAGDGSGRNLAQSNIWKPTEDFLLDAGRLREAAVLRAVLEMRGDESQGGNKFEPELNVIGKPANHHAKRQTGEDREIEATTEVPAGAVTDVVGTQQTAQSFPTLLFPTIILTHVPFYRAPDTSCGPLREGRPAILIMAGYQYQNVLTPATSLDIVQHLAAEEIVMIYSGDDHDYCEVEHTEFTGRIREITVKSISWAMGIRKPGIQLTSLWNPVDLSLLGTDAKPAVPQNTIQNHMCLLPDQLAIFINYAKLLVFTTVVLVIRAIHFKRPNNQQQRQRAPTLEQPEAFPTISVQRAKPTEKETIQTRNERSLTSSSSSSISASSQTDHQTQSYRNNSTRTKLGGYNNVPSSMSRSSSPTPDPRVTTNVNTPLPTPSQSQPQPQTSLPDPFAPISDSHVISMSTPTINNTTTTTNDYFPTYTSTVPQDADDWTTPNQSPSSRRKITTQTRPESRFDVLKRSFWHVSVPVVLFYALLLWLDR